MKRWVVALAAMCLFTVSISPAFGSGACCPAPCGPVCSTPCYTYVTEYRKVQRTVCEYVPVTVMQDCTEVVCIPVTTKEERSETYYETVTKTVPTKQTHYVCEWVKKKIKVNVCKPVTKMVEQTYTVRVPVTRVEKQKYTVCVPFTRVEERTQPVVVCETVPVTKCYPVTTYHQVPVCCAPTCAPCAPCASSCGSCGSCGGCAPACAPVSCCYQTVPVTTMHTCTEYQTVHKTIMQKYQVQICDYKTEVREQDVTICDWKDEIRKQQVAVCSYETVQEDAEVAEQVTKAVETTVNVTHCELVPKVRKYHVDVVTYKHETRVKKVPVCTYQLVTKVIEECVPVTVAVPCCPAPCGGCPAPCGSCAAPAPCCY